MEFLRNLPTVYKKNRCGIPQKCEELKSINGKKGYEQIPAIPLALEMP